jgi:hypothetical protein
MPILHLIEISLADGIACAEWRNDTDWINRPVAPEGRLFVDVTSRNELIGMLLERGARYENGALVVPE